MKALEEKIRREGIVVNEDIVKVGSFLNQQIDVGFLMEMGREAAGLFEGEGVTKVLTVEASGIAFAVAVAAAMGVPAVFAKKHENSNLSGDQLAAKVYSFTHEQYYDVVVPRDYISSEDVVLLADDFLAGGQALNGLRGIVAQAGARCVGAVVEVEKSFQSGGEILRNDGMRIEALARIRRLDPVAKEIEFE
ncbi:MAG: xanthine phosphoribosyltransferase [Lachnospiraceae bacterium]